MTGRSLDESWKRQWSLCGRKKWLGPIAGANETRIYVESAKSTVRGTRSCEFSRGSQAHNNASVYQGRCVPASVVLCRNREGMQQGTWQETEGTAGERGQCLFELLCVYLELFGYCENVA